MWDLLKNSHIFIIVITFKEFYGVYTYQKGPVWGTNQIRSLKVTMLSNIWSVFLREL